MVPWPRGAAHDYVVQLRVLRFEGVADRHDIDLSVLAFGTVGMLPSRDGTGKEKKRWYSDENGVVEMANALETDHAASFEYPRRLDVVEIGDRVDL